MTIVRLVECSDYDECYGYITSDANIGRKELQDKISEIKGKFYKEGFEDWCVEDVIEELPEEWKIGYFMEDDVVEI